VIRKPSLPWLPRQKLPKLRKHTIEYINPGGIPAALLGLKNRVESIDAFLNAWQAKEMDKQ
jgi:hypothetical protein